MSSLDDLSRDLAALVERAGKGVVRVSARRGRPATGIAWAEDLVLTADHAVEQESGITVSTGTAEVTATIAGRDPGTDLALLRTDRSAATVLARGKGADLRVGHLVMAIGRPRDIQATLGIVSALGGSFRNWRGGDDEGLIHTNAELLTGFSGGPLLDSGGTVVGINSWNYGRGASRALPVETAEQVVKALLQHGRIRRAYLGLGTQPIRLAAPAGALAGQDGGLLVVAVDPGGPAASAGVMQGDVVLAVSGIAAQRLDDMFGALHRLEVGAVAGLRLLRAGEVRDLTVTTGERSG
ncbi:MAG: S1C family serine protease [Candidatus Dormibacteraeota bacterium]|nr:S1C family serine protease [Candidatus Dormibacteraeota bacterium]